MFEKKRGTRFLASVMALVMLLSLAPVGALAAKGSNDNESYDTQDTFNIEGVETYYPLSGESNNNFTEARYIWEKDNTVYLAFIISYGQGNDKPILSATASNNELNVGTILYANLKFGENNEIPATGKKVSRWQIATCEGSIQSLLNTGNTLTISADTGAGGYDLDRVEYTVKDYPIPGEPGGGGGTPGGSDGDGDQQEANERLYIAIIKGDPANLTLPQEPGFSTSYDYYFVQNSEGNYSLTEWSTDGPVFSDNAGSYVNVDAFNNATKAETTNNNGGRVTGIFAEDGIDLNTYFSTTISEENIIRAYLNERGITGNAGDYTLVPYVLKYEDYSSDGYDGYYTPAHGYHLDCYIIKKDNVKVTYNVNLDGATTEYTVPADISVAKDTQISVSKWTKESTEVEDSAVTATKDGKTYEFKGWSTTPSEPADASGLYAAGRELPVTTDTTLYAIWKEKEEEQTTPSTDTVDAKYFVLMPSANAPSSGRSQGWENYFPSERTENGKKITDDGGVEGASRATGYAGKITQDAANLVKNEGDNGYFKETGVEDTYLAEKPTNLGYFDRQNYNQTVSPWTYTGHGPLPATLSGFTMEGKEVVWYVIKNAGTTTTPDYHVDGYVKGVDIEVKYHQNFAEGTSWTQTGLESGDTVEIKNYTEVWQDSSHEGYTFTGWNTKANGTGDSYVANTDAVLKTSMDLYAQWEKDVWTDADAKDNPSAEDKDSKDKGDGIPDSQQILIEYKAYKEGNGTVEPGFEVITVKKDGTLTPTKGSTANAETGYVFVTWSDKNAVVNETTVDSIVSSAAATTKTAKWTPNLTASDKGKTYTYTAIFLEDKVGDKNEDGTDKGDGIPDAWQYKVTFKVVNGKWNDHDNSDNIVVYVNAKGKDGKTLESKLTEAQIPAVGEKPNSGYRASGSWDKSLSADLIITGDTEFTFTYSRRSSGGSSRPSTPTVTIPDDVPTGLNGKDHYAYIIGYGNNDVRPQNNITRAEVATIFFRLLTDETRTANMTKSNGYNDVKDGDWFCCAVSTLSKMGIIKGYEDGSFKPNDPISRAEFAAIAARFDPDGDKTPATFADVTSHWAKDEISIAANHGWIKGYEDGSFKPDQKITRAETMTLVNRVLNRLPETKDDLHKDMKTWVDNMDETAWYYLDVQEATNSHYFKNKTGTKFEQWTDLRDTRDWSELEK